MSRRHPDVAKPTGDPLALLEKADADFSLAVCVTSALGGGGRPPPHGGGVGTKQSALPAWGFGTAPAWAWNILDLTLEIPERTHPEGAD